MCSAWNICILCVQYNQYITDKICEYKEVSIKAQYDDTSLEVDLHEQNDLGTE